MLSPSYWSAVPPSAMKIFGSMVLEFVFSFEGRSENCQAPCDLDLEF